MIWDPEPIAFTLPLIDHPIPWYSLFFATGFFLSYFVVRHRFQIDFSLSKEQASQAADRFALYLLIGTIVGARLGHVIFYDPSLFWIRPLEVFQTWKGGLASHGGVAGVVIAACCFLLKTKKEIPSLTLRNLLDMLALPAALTGVFIRIGNFWNQEILGVPTTLPWGISFLHPLGGGTTAPRHPAQLYEAFSLALIGLICWSLYRKKLHRNQPGSVAGIFFILTFTSRFFIEFIKTPQSEWALEGGILLMGQYLSLPLILWGGYLYLTSSSNRLGS